MPADRVLKFRSIPGVQAQTGASAPAPVFRIHSIGPKAWSADDGGAAKDIWGLPASAQMRRHVLDRLSLSVAQGLEPKAAGQPTDTPALRPLLDNLWKTEWYLEILEQPQGGFERTLALRLDEAQERVWQADWAKVDGWRPKASLQTSAISLLSTNHWTALHGVGSPAGGSAGPSSEASLWTRLHRAQLPSDAARDAWFTVDVDLAKWRLGQPKDANLPRVQLAVGGRNEYLRTQGQLTFPRPLGIAVQGWQIPMGMIRDPLISFTAVQGIASWLKQKPIIQELGLGDIPNQLYLWGMSQTAFQIQGAVPVANAGQAFERIAAKWVPEFNAPLSRYAVGNIVRLTDRPSLIWERAAYPGALSRNGPGRGSGLPALWHLPG